MESGKGTMINESGGSQDSLDGDEDQEIDDTPADSMLGQFEGVIGAAIEKAVSQYRALLSQGLETEVKRIVTEFEVATADVDQAVAKQTRARLSELVESEVREEGWSGEGEGGEGRNMLAFETLTLAPIDRNLIEVAILSPEETTWLDAYHARVRAAHRDQLDPETAQ